ncbi:uncharacterized protein LOC131159376 [Malania oleifera]|uniref:uncharacterized protein LOC131159376 n=1 Tax=Malania oleifera TaxID=397392 RepID=UPI0025AEB2C0|nr:uncharacterized protein LOC131159376 [Malania oleifera]
MPLPWKKSRVPRISRLVADLQSPKRRGSLVIETGFPTSLIDLFVKNQDRLKKSSKKKKVKLSSEVAGPAFNSPEKISSSSCAVPEPLEIATPRCQNGLNGDGSATGDVGEADCLVGADEVDDGDGDSVANGVFFVVFKIFLVLVLALGTKKLAVGITMSAFLLLFLEYVGKHVFCFLRPCSAAQKRLNSLIQRVLILVRRKDRVLLAEEIEEENSAAPASSCLVVALDSTASAEEIQIVESNYDSVAPGEEIQIAEPNFDLLSRDKRWGSIEVNSRKKDTENDEDGCEFSGVPKQRSRSGTLKTKILLRKLVPKKLRTSKKGRKSKDKDQESSSELSGHIGESVPEMSAAQEQLEGGDQAREDEDKSMPSSWREEMGGEEEDINAAISSIDNFLQTKVETAVGREEVGRFRKENSGYLILLSIVLAGLAGGRILAFTLTLAWFLMLKSVGFLRKLMNESTIKSPTENSG